MTHARNTPVKQGALLRTLSAVIAATLLLAVALD